MSNSRRVEELGRSEELFRLLVEGIPDYAVFMLDPEGRVLSWNAGARSIQGYEAEEVVGEHFSRFYAPEDVERGRPEQGLRAAEESGRYEEEGWRVRKDGSRFWAGVLITALRDEGGALIGFSSAVRDVTGRKRDEEMARFLSEASDVLFASLGYHETLASVAELAVPFLADWCAVDVLAEDGSPERVAVVHRDPGKAALARELRERYPPDPNASAGLARALRTGEAEVVPEVPDSLLEAIARDDEHRRVLDGLGLSSYVVAPLTARGRTFGALTLVMAESGRSYGAKEFELAKELSRRAAVAADNARLHEEAQRELSERRRVQDELRRQSDLYETLLQAQSEVGEGFVIAEGPRIFYANEAFCEISGYTERELLELPTFFELFLPEERSAFLERFERRMGGGEGESHQEITLRRKDGRAVDLEIAVKESRTEGVPRFVIVARDVTERKRAGEALRQSEERYRAVVEQAAEGIILVDGKDKRVLEANPEFLRLFGYAPEEVAGLSIYDLVAHDRESVDDNIERTLEEGNRVVGERRYRRKDGTLVDVMVSGSAISYGERRVVSIVIRDITERKRAEEELRRSERGLAAAQRIASLGNFEYDVRKDRARWSEELYRIFGHDPESFKPRYRSFLAAVHPDDRGRVKGAVRRVLLTGDPGGIEYRIVRPDGEVRNVETHYELRRGEGGEPTLFVGTVQDITERKATERKLREAEALFRTLVEQIPAITYIEDPYDKSVRYMSPQYEDILGYSPDLELRDKDHWVKTMHPEDRERVLAEDARTDATGEPFKAEYRRFASDGRLVWIRDEAVLVRDEEGNPLYWLGVQFDVTEQKQAEEELRRSEERYRAVVEQAAEGIFLVDPTTKRFLEANAEYQRMLGYTSEELLGMTLYDVVAHEREDIDEKFRRSLEERSFVIGERRHRRKDGSLMDVIANSSPVFYGGRQVVCYVVHDITERKRFEEELEARAEELARSNAELEQFAYIASHDLQEPLRMVSSYTQLLARRYKGELDEDADEFISYAVDGATRMQTLINDLLSYSRVGTRGKKLAPTDLRAVFEAACNNLRVAIEESGATVVAGDLPAVMGDDTQLVQLFQNLIGNSIKFRSVRPPEVRVEAGRRGREWVVSVRDNGVGFERQYADRIFVIFQRLHTRGEYAGTGIGLAVCKKIVERHGGRIWAESEPGEGSAFYFTLPAEGGEPG